jgi:hypothetical protein
MPSDELTLRIKRIYGAVDAIVETNISQFMPEVIRDGKRIGFYQDWSGGRTNAEIENIAHILIYNVANLKDHLRKWAESNGKDKTKVNTAFKDSQALKIIKDLSNNDRHGYDPEKKGNSGKSPRIEKINTIMQMTTKPEKGAFMCLTFNHQGVSQIAGSGNAKVIITGDILDKDGNKIGDLHDTLLKAIKDWENVLVEFGVNIPGS